MNVTPLVDVVLVLLIIFMVVIPALDSGMVLEVPSVRNSDDENHNVDPFLLSIDRASAVYFDDARIDPANLEPTLRRASRAAPGRRIVLRADGHVPYGQVRTLYRMVQRVGFPGVSLRVSQQHNDGAAGAGS
jgi:biopolymer transport protein ExbD